jgi:hypothetical protein
MNDLLSYAWARSDAKPLVGQCDVSGSFVGAPFCYQCAGCNHRMDNKRALCCAVVAKNGDVYLARHDFDGFGAKTPAMTRIAP